MHPPISHRLARQADPGVAVVAVGDPGRLEGDARTAAEATRSSGVSIQPLACAGLPLADVLVDALKSKEFSVPTCLSRKSWVSADR